MPDPYVPGYDQVITEELLLSAKYAKPEKLAGLIYNAAVNHLDRQLFIRTMKQVILILRGDIDVE